MIPVEILVWVYARRKEVKMVLLDRQTKEPAVQDMVLAMVNDKPCLYIEERIDRDSIPEGLVMYEAADCCDGRLSRISDRILVNFVGTLIGKDELPMKISHAKDVEGIEHEYRDYYARRDEAYDEAYSEWEDSLPADMDDDAYEEAYEAFCDEHWWEDKDYAEYSVMFGSLDDYLAQYDELVKEYGNRGMS